MDMMKSLEHLLAHDHVNASFDILFNNNHTWTGLFHLICITCICIRKSLKTFLTYFSHDIHPIEATDVLVQAIFPCHECFGSYSLFQCSLTYRCYPSKVNLIIAIFSFCVRLGKSKISPEFLCMSTKKKHWCAHKSEKHYGLKLYVPIGLNKSTVARSEEIIQHCSTREQAL